MGHNITVPGILINSALRVQPHPPLVSGSGSRHHNGVSNGLITMTQYPMSTLNPTRHRVLGQLSNVPVNGSGISSNTGHLYTISGMGNVGSGYGTRNSRFLAMNNYNASTVSYFGRSAKANHTVKGYASGHFAIPDGQVNLTNHHILSSAVGNSVNNVSVSPTKYAYRQKHDGTVEWRIDNAAVAFQDRRRIYSAGARGHENSGF